MFVSCNNLDVFLISRQGDLLTSAHRRVAKEKNDSFGRRETAFPGLGSSRCCWHASVDLRGYALRNDDFQGRLVDQSVIHMPGIPAQSKPRMNHDKSITWRESDAIASVALRWPTSETSRNTAFVRAGTEAPFSGAAAGARCLAWNAIDRQVCSLRQHESSEGIRKASDFESRQELPLAGGWTIVQSRSFVRIRSICFVSFLRCLIKAAQLVAFTTMVDGHSRFDLASAPGRQVHLNFQRFSLLNCFAYPWNNQAWIVKKKKAKFNFKWYRSWQLEVATETRRCSGVLEKSSRGRLNPSAIDLHGSSLLFFDQSKK